MPRPQILTLWWLWKRTMALSNFSELLLPADIWTGIAHYYVSLPFYPVFQTVHFVLTAAALRNEDGSLQFAFKHPVASWVLTFIVACSGGILSNLALARPPLEAVLNGWNVLICTLAWYLIFFSPLDLFYLLTLLTPLRLVLLLVKELARAKKIFAGVTLAASVYPQSLLAMAIVGMFKGSGNNWGITLYHLAYSPQLAGKHELLQLSYGTKVSFLCGMIHAYNQKTSFIDPPTLLLFTAILLVSVRLGLFFTSIVDPFLATQGLSWRLMTCLSLTPRGLHDSESRSKKSKTQSKPAKEVKTEKQKED